MANPLKLPFDFPPNGTPTTHQLQANFNALLQFVQDLNDAVVSLTNLLVGTLTTTSTATIGGALAANSTLGVSGDLTASSKVKLSDGSAGAPSLTFTTSTAMGVYKVATNSLALTTSSTQAVNVDSAGNVLQPVQPSFLVYRSAALGNSQTGDVDPFVFPTEAYDIGGNFASNTFTAPVTGKYFLAYSVNIGPNGGTPATFFRIDLTTSNQGFRQFIGAPLPTNDSSYTASVVADMDAGDTARVAVDVLTGGTTWQSEVDALSYFTGTLIN